MCDKSLRASSADGLLFFCLLLITLFLSPGWLECLRSWGAPQHPASGSSATLPVHTEVQPQPASYLQVPCPHPCSQGDVVCRGPEGSAGAAPPAPRKHSRDLHHLT